MGADVERYGATPSQPPRATSRYRTRGARAPGLDALALAMGGDGRRGAGALWGRPAL
jgi:hypothetical protein